jgi:hypothetical protein
LISKRSKNLFLQKAEENYGIQGEYLFDQGKAFEKWGDFFKT